MTKFMKMFSQGHLIYENILILVFQEQCATSNTIKFFEKCLLRNLF